MAGLSGFSFAAAREEVDDRVPLCAGADPDAWFERNDPQVRLCLRICAECPLRTSCLAGALARDEQEGVWGGLRFTPRWVDGHVQANKVWWALYGHDQAGNPLRRPQSESNLAEVEQQLRRLLYQGRRRAFVSRWVRRVGRPVRTAGGWWIGPWTDPDPDRRVAWMRRSVPMTLADRPVERWPWELRLLAELPAAAIPRPKTLVAVGRPLARDRGDHTRRPYGRRAA